MDAQDDSGGNQPAVVLRGKPTLRHNLAGFARRDGRVGSRLGAMTTVWARHVKAPVIDRPAGWGMAGQFVMRRGISFCDRHAMKF